MAAEEILEIHPKNPNIKQIRVTFIGDGYIASQKQKFIDDARNVFEAVRNNEIWNKYKDHWYAMGLWFTSNEEGADHPLKGIYKDTAFGGICDGADERYARIIDRSKAINEFFAIQVPGEESLNIVILNDTTYGGSAGSWYMTITTHPWTSEIVIHEVGHNFANLLDEYDFGANGSYAKFYNPINISDTGDPSTVKWKSYIDKGLVGNPCQQGADWWTPLCNCKMRTLFTDFCPICKDALMASFRFSTGIPPDQEVTGSKPTVIVTLTITKG